jgi:anti-anti-sigma factor
MILMTDPNTHDFLSVQTAADGAIVVSGDVDIAGGPILEAALLQRGKDDRLVIDLAGVSFMDSSGLRNLLAASRRANQRGAALILRNVGPVVWRLLEITRTASQFAVESRLS